jgi:diguanylate cyclase (GGDEF)-like protein
MELLPRRNRRAPARPRPSGGAAGAGGGARRPVGRWRGSGTAAPRHLPTAARSGPPARALGRPRTRAALARTLLAAALPAGLAALAGGGEAYWLCLPAVLVACAGCRTRAGTAAAAATVIAAALAATAVRSPAAAPSLPLALLVPAASAAVLLALRERLEAEREVMRRSALTDPLTGVANRRSLLARIEYEISRHHRARRPFGVLMLDLDGFKALNDRFGHPAGDDLLRDVAAAIGRAVRDQDTVARMGGDEFCVLAPETDLTGARQLAARVLAAIGTVTAGIDALGASCGVCAFPLDGRAMTELLEVADQRLLDAKRRRGRGRARHAA